MTNIAKLPERHPQLRTLMASELEARERFEATFAQAAVGIVHVDLEGRIALVNDRACEILGYAREELLGRAVRDLSHPEDLDKAVAQRDRLVAGAIGTFSVEKRFLRKDGSPVWMNVTMSLARGTDGRPRYKIGVFEDITVRKSAELRAQRLSTMYAALSAANDAIVRARSTEDLFRRVCEAVVSSGAFQLAAIRLLEPDTGWLRPVAASGRAALFGKVQISVREELPEGGLPMAVAVREDRSIVVNDYQGDPALVPWRAQAARAGIRSAAYCPLHHAGAVVGAMSLLADECDYFDDEMVGLLQRLGENVSFALGSLEGEAERQRMGRMYAALSALNEAIPRAATAEELLRRACEIAVGSGNFLLAAVRLVDRDTLQARMVASAGPDRLGFAGRPVSVDESKPEGRLLVGTAYRAGRPVVARDFARDPRTTEAWRKLGESAGIRSFGVFPLRQGGECVGMLLLHGAEHAAFDGEMEKLLERMADNISFGLDNLDRETRRRASEEALRDSEARFRSLTELSSDWYWELDAEFRFTTFERRGQAGDYRPTAVLGKTPWEIPGLTLDPAALELHRARHLRHEPYRDFEYSYRTRSGKRYCMRVNGEPTFDADGRFTGYRGTSRDISAQRRGEDELRRFRAALDAAGDMVFLIDMRDARIIDMNLTACRSLGYERDELIGRSGKVIGRGERSRERLLAEYRRLLASDARTEQLVVRYCRKDGTTFPAEVLRKVLETPEGPVLVVSARDLTERRIAEENLLRFRAAMDMSGDLILLVDRDSMRYVDVNDTACRLLGYSRDELLAMGPHELLPATREQLERVYDAMIADGIGQESGEIELRCRDGSLLPVEFTRHALRLADRWIIAAISRDIRERIRTQDELRRFRVAMDHSADMIVLIDRSTMRFVDVNDTVCRILGYSRAELLQMGPQDVLPESREELERAYDEFIADPSRSSGMKSHYRCKDGSLVPFESTRQALKSGDIWIIAAISRDIRERVAAEEALRKSNERLAYLAQFDELTGLPNRSLLGDRLEQAIAQARRRRHSAAVLFVDLDRFKLVNDTLGHAAGDGLLAEAARRLKANVRAEDTVGRISGDEFAVILADLARPEDAEVVARKLIAALAAPFDLRGQEAFVSASIGIALTPDDGEDAETLLKHADAAMYRAKESGRNTFCFFTAELNRRAASRMRLAAELRHALERDEFRLHYQPKFDARTLELRGVEALLRWQHPVRGLVAPNDFVPVLEETGLIVPVGEWVLHEACRQLRVWQERGAAPLSVAVNISPRQFRDRQFARSVRTITHAAGVDPRHIELEITEGYLMEDPEEASRVLAGLREAGLRVSVDDFGTGYSSLSYLTRFPLTALKIDRSFVRKLGEEQSAEVLVRAIIDLAHNLGFEVVAEGVETERQLAFLRAHGCDQAQGYLLGRPEPEQAISARLQRELEGARQSEHVLG